MAQKGLSNFFESFLQQNSLFEDKKVLQSSHTPDVILHRDEQIKQAAAILAPSLKLDRPSNIFVYGKTGTGKTLSIKYTTKQISELAEKKEIPLSVFYLNCKLKRIADTEYRLIAGLTRAFGEDIPPTGLPTDEVYRIFYKTIEKKKQLLIIVLDEIDHLVKKAGDELLYNLVRINEELKKSQVSIIGISNDLIFADNLDPRIKSSLSEEEILFPPYNALQIQHILKRRSKAAFKNNVVKEGVIEKCAALAAREHGDARRALELLRVAGEMAERHKVENLTLKYLEIAEEKIEKDRLIDAVLTQPKQHQVVLYSILRLYNPKKESIFTGEIYELYRDICKKTNLRPLTQRRVSDVLSELDMLGIISARVISKGRYGRTREIRISLSSTIKQNIDKLLSESLDLQI